MASGRGTSQCSRALLRKVSCWPLNQQVATFRNSGAKHRRSGPAADSVSSPGQSLGLGRGS